MSFQERYEQLKRDFFEELKSAILKSKNTSAHVNGSNCIAVPHGGFEELIMIGGDLYLINYDGGYYSAGSQDIEILIDMFEGAF